MSQPKYLKAVVFHPTVPQGDDTLPTPLPHWYPQAFSHLGPEEYATVCDLWQGEPLLRELVAALDEQNPALRTFTACPYCHTPCTGVMPNATLYRCGECNLEHSLSTGTVFFRMPREVHYRLYTTLITEWGSWSVTDTLRISGCLHKPAYQTSQRRLQPILARVAGRVVTSQPRYLRGFTPVQQGLSCPRCQSDDLRYSEHHPVPNPMIRCQSCRHRFPTIPDVPRGLDPYRYTGVSNVPLPAWFVTELAHLTPEQYRHVVDVWNEEALLRQVIAELDAQNPTLNKAHDCPHCGSRRFDEKDNRYFCRACDSYFSLSTNTVYRYLLKANYRRPYLVAVMLWTSWRVKKVLPFCKVKSFHMFRVYKKLVLGVLAEFVGDGPVTRRPRYLLGFKPGQQGVRCVRCQSANLITDRMTPADNPLIWCRDCGRKFALHASGR